MFRNTVKKSRGLVKAICACEENDTLENIHKLPGMLNRRLLPPSNPRLHVA